MLYKRLGLITISRYHCLKLLWRSMELVLEHGAMGECGMYDAVVVVIWGRSIHKLKIGVQDAQ